MSQRKGIIPTAQEELRHLGILNESTAQIREITVIDTPTESILDLTETFKRLGLSLAEPEARDYFAENTKPAAVPAPAAPQHPAPAAITEEGCKIKIEGGDMKKEEPDEEEDDDEMDEAISSVTDTLESGFLGSVVESLLVDESLTEDEFVEAIDMIANESTTQLNRMIREAFYEESNAALTAQEVTEALALQKPLSEKRIMARLVGGVKMRLQKSSAAEKKAARAYYKANKAKILKASKIKRKKPAFQRKLARQVAKAISMGTRKESVAPANQNPAPALQENFAPAPVATQQPAAPSASIPAPAAPAAQAPSPTRARAQAQNSNITAVLNEARQYLSQTPADPIKAELSRIANEAQEMSDTFVESAQHLGQPRFTDAAMKARTLSRAVNQVLTENVAVTSTDLQTIRQNHAMLNGQLQVAIGELRRFSEATGNAGKK